MYKIPKNYDEDYNQVKQDVIAAYCRITRKIWVYLEANPNILAANNNLEVLDELFKIQTNIYLRHNPNQTREEEFSTKNFISDLEAKYNADDYYFRQELLDLFTLVKWFGNTNWFKKLWKGKFDRMVAKLQNNGVEDTPYEDKEW